MFRKIIRLIVSAVAVFSSAVFAVGLGKSDLKSGLNQPLNAEIRLLSAQELSEHELTVNLASEVEFEKLGVDRLFFLNGIRFKTVRDENGNLIIKLSSREAIKEPFLNFVVALNYPKGRLVKEYTFLLDPPIYDNTASSTIAKTSTQPTREAQPRAQQTQAADDYQPTSGGSSYGPVSGTDTLWGIANKTRPNSQVTLHQTLVAIYRANPDAFAKGNINNLLKGKVLQIPDAETISQVPHRAALQDVVMQNKQWRNTRRVAASGDQTSAKPVVSSEPRLSLATQDSEQISGSNVSGSQGGASTAEVEQALLKSQEMSATLQAENEELRSRLADLLKRVETLTNDAAINIDDAELAALTQPKSQTTNTSTADSATTESIDEMVDASDEMATDSDSGQAASDQGEATDSATDPMAAQNELTNATQAASTQTKPVQSTPTSTVPNVVVGNQQASSIWDSGWLLGGIVGGIGLIVIGVLWRMRQRMDDEEFQDNLVASAGAGSMDSTESFELPEVGDDMLDGLEMDEYSEEDVTADDEKFDPLGEADIYIAYGKIEQAESLLLESIEENPIRSDLKVKLMECYAESENKDKFDALAEEVSQAVDAEEWQQQISMMREKVWSGQTAEADEFDLPSTEDIFGEEEPDFDADEGDVDAQLSDESEDNATDESFSLDEVDNADELEELDLDEQEEAEAFNLEDEDLTEEDDLLADDSDSSADEFSLDDEAVDDDQSALDDDEVSLDEESLDDFDLDDDAEFDLDMDIDQDDSTTAEPEISESESAGAEIAESDAVTETFDAIDDAQFSLDDEQSIDDDIDEASMALDDQQADEFSLDDDEADLDNEIALDDTADDDDFDDEDDVDEISTKLDLARAYIDMGDSEGAKEILSEVLEDGTDAQIEEAKALIEKAD